MILWTLITRRRDSHPSPLGRETRGEAVYHATLRGLLERMK